MEPKIRNSDGARGRVTYIYIYIYFCWSDPAYTYGVNELIRSIITNNLSKIDVENKAPAKILRSKLAINYSSYIPEMIGLRAEEETAP